MAVGRNCLPVVSKVLTDVLVVIPAGLELCVENLKCFPPES